MRFLLCATLAFVSFAACSGSTDDASSSPHDGGATDGAANTSDGGTLTTADGAVIDVGPCGANAAACAGDGCPESSCFAPSHVASGFGGYVATKGLFGIALVANTAFDTKTGQMGKLRAANANAKTYEVRTGVGFVRIAQGAGEPDIALWVFDSLDVVSGTMTFTGDAAVVLATAKYFTIESGAVLDASAKGRTPGPGGFLGGGYGSTGTGCAPGIGTPSGAGGGAYGSNGGSGNGSLGGNAAGCASYGELAILRGGSGGGGADDSNSQFADPMGGAGGGALQLTALGNLTLNGVVVAGGGGGRSSEGNWRNGAGGGAGGAIFIESPAIKIGASAGLYANGGGAGSASPGTGGSCTTPAQDGQASLTPAMGSHCGAAGGDGAAADVAAKNGVGSSGSGYGGGGGGLGRIVLRTLPSATPNVATTNVSPLTSSDAYRVLKTLGQ